jgi:GntR family transcriptional regulator, transcriptional repressor for pyruvate dehydrogenase complex
MALPRRNTVVAETARELRERILAGKLKPGEYLPSQKTLAGEFGVGMSTIHEALQVLSSAGLVQSCPGKGTWVSEDALDTLVHPAAIKSRLGDMSFWVLHEARSVIEVTLAELAAERARPEDMERIWAAVNAMEAMAADADDAAYAQKDLEFHLAVAKAGHNELLEQFYHLAFKLFSEFLSEVMALPEAKRELFQAHNRTLAEAIQTRERRRARQAAVEIIKDVDRVLEPVILQSGPNGQSTG